MNQRAVCYHKAACQIMGTVTISWGYTPHPRTHDGRGTRKYEPGGSGLAFELLLLVCCSQVGTMPGNAIDQRCFGIAVCGSNTIRIIDVIDHHCIVGESPQGELFSLICLVYWKLVYIYTSNGCYNKG